MWWLLNPTTHQSCRAEAFQGLMAKPDSHDTVRASEYVHSGASVVAVAPTASQLCWAGMKSPTIDCEAKEQIKTILTVWDLAADSIGAYLGANKNYLKS